MDEAIAKFIKTLDVQQLTMLANIVTSFGIELFELAEEQSEEIEQWEMSPNTIVQWRKP